MRYVENPCLWGVLDRYAPFFLIAGGQKTLPVSWQALGQTMMAGKKTLHKNNTFHTNPSFFNFIQEKSKTILDKFVKIAPMQYKLTGRNGCLL